MLSRREALLGGAILASTVTTGALAKPARTPAQLHRIDPGKVAIDWPAGGAFEVRMSSQPDAGFTKVLARQARGEWTGEGPVSPRPYYRVSGPGGADEVAERLLPLGGGRNFRDLGGYRAVDGRMVRWGQLYRSGSMVGLTDADYRYLSSLGIKVICDFRTGAERAREPTSWGGPKMITRDYETDAGFFKKFATNPPPSAEQARGMMVEMYRELPYEHADSYRLMFGELVDGKTPLTFNCSAGKDRTGVAAALILTTLGVPRATVIQDFELTNKTVDLHAISRQGGQTGKGGGGFLGLNALPPTVLDAMMRADGAYLQAAFETMAKRDGSVAGFLAKRCGLSPAGANVLRQRLLKTV